MFAVVRPTLAQAQSVNARAEQHFQTGARALARAERLRGARAERLYEQALSEFVQTLGLVPSRNAMFNAALACEGLDRLPRAFAYYQLYLAVDGLSDEERREGQERVERLSESVGVLTLSSTPSGASVYVDRLDLAPVGQTPLTLAVMPGDHRFIVRAEGHDDAEFNMSFSAGQTAERNEVLRARPVVVTFVVDGEGELLVNGEPSEHQVELLPGEHLATVSYANRHPVERTFVVQPGHPLRVEISESDAAVVPSRIVVESESGAVYVDNVLIGELSNGRLESELDSGPHDVRLESEQGEIRERIMLEPAHEMRFAVTPASRRLGAWPHVFLGATLVSGAAFATLATVALLRNGSFKDQCPGVGQSECQSLFNDVENFNLAADITLGVTGALAITTLVLYLVNRPGDPEVDIESSPILVGAAPSRGGANVALEGRF